MKRKKWYAVPPYKNEGWQILDESGELVATFELQEDCEIAVECYNDFLETQKNLEL